MNEFQFLVSDYDEDKSEINSINSSLFKNEEFMSDSGFNFINESPFTSNMPSFITQENTKKKYEISIPTPEFKEVEKNQKEEVKLTQKKREQPNVMLGFIIIYLKINTIQKPTILITAK